MKKIREMDKIRREVDEKRNEENDKSFNNRQ